MNKLDFEFSKRFHFFEFLDLPWLPNYLRDGMRAYLNGMHIFMKYYKPWAQLIAETIKHTNDKSIVVLGGGGILLPQLIQKELREKHNLNIKMYHTDLYPILDQKKLIHPEDNIEFIEESVDMTNVPEKFDGLRFIPLAFHHLPPTVAEKVLQDAYSKNKTILVSEITKNSIVAHLSSLILFFYQYLIITFFARPFRWDYIFSCVLFPIIPALIVFDGVISNIRTYSKKEYNTLTQRLQNQNYEWKFIEQKVLLHHSPITTLLGSKKN